MILRTQKTIKIKVITTSNGIKKEEALTVHTQNAVIVLVCFIIFVYYLLLEIFSDGHLNFECLRISYRRWEALTAEKYLRNDPDISGCIYDKVTWPEQLYGNDNFLEL